MGNWQGTRRPALAAAAAGIAISISGCSVSTPTARPPASPAVVCGVTGLPAETKGLCLTTASVGRLPGDAIEPIFEQADFDQAVGGYLQFETGTLTDDGSILAAAYGDDQDDPAHARPRVGLLSSAGFQEFARNQAADSPVDLVAATRDGSTVAWLEQSVDPTGLNAGYDWSAWTATGRTASVAATQADVEPTGLSLDTDDPGPILKADLLSWRLVPLDDPDPDSGSASPATVPSAAWLASHNLSTHKTVTTETTDRLNNLALDGARYTITSDSDATGYTLSRTDEAGTTAPIAHASKTNDAMVSDVQVMRDAVIWVVTPRDGGQPPVGANQPDNMPELPSPTSQPTTTTGTPGASPKQADGTSIFVYRPDSGQLLRVDTRDSFLEPSSVAVADSRVAWAGTDDDEQYVVNTKDGSIASLGACQGCGLVGLSKKDTVLYATPDDSGQATFVAHVGRFSRR